MVSLLQAMTYASHANLALGMYGKHEVNDYLNDGIKLCDFLAKKPLGQWVVHRQNLMRYPKWQKVWHKGEIAKEGLQKLIAGEEIENIEEVDNYFTTFLHTIQNYDSVLTLNGVHPD